MGKNQARLLRFAIQYPTWHTYGKDRATVNAIRSLASYGVVEVNEHRQFRLAMSDYYKAIIDGCDKLESV